MREKIYYHCAQHQLQLIRSLTPNRVLCGTTLVATSEHFLAHFKEKDNFKLCFECYLKNSPRRYHIIISHAITVKANNARVGRREKKLFVNTMDMCNYYYRACSKSFFIDALCPLNSRDKLSMITFLSLT